MLLQRIKLVMTHLLIWQVTRWVAPSLTSVSWRAWNLLRKKLRRKK